MPTARGLNSVNYERIFNNPLRTALLIVFGLANLNNGLTSYVTKNYNSDDLHRNINQNLIMSPMPPAASAALISGAPSTAALTVASTSSFSEMPLPAPNHQQSSISASSSLFQQTSGSSITSFDSTNVIDERQREKQRQLAKDTIAARPLHKIVGVVGAGMRSSAISSVSGGAASEAAGIANHLDGGSNSAESGVDGEIFTAPMYFGTENSTVVTTQIGATAHIPCSVHHIGDGVVSWIRKKDYHLLTVGLTTYSSDERFSAAHLKHSEDWTLQIKFVQLRDAGVYECQVSTHPPTSIFLHLNVVEARAEISGPPIRYLTPGSTLRLQCRVVQNTEASEFIFWYHDNRMINYDIDRGINVSTEPDFQSSELTILRTRREHSGNFTCVASNTQPASVLVHIFKGDNPAAMYHGHVGSSTKSYQTHLHSIMAIIAIGYRILHTHVHIKIV